MKEKRYQGFTLIELLAVIVILAVIALIATPLIMNVINDAKKSAARDAGYNVIKAGELAAATAGIENQEPPYHYDQGSNLPMKGTKPTKFTLDIDKNMKTQLRAWINGFCVVKEYGNETVTIDESKKTENECVKVTYKKYDNGTAIYFNPEINKKCSESEYRESNSLNENKSGCMKWYVFNDSESSSTVNAILDHNTTYGVRWSSTDDSSTRGDAVKLKLAEDTTTWNKGLKPRLIDAYEIAEITGNDKFYADERDISWFYFENNSKTDPELSQGQAKYKWLFDYTNNCTDYGCSIADNSTVGYWTSTPISPFPGSAWRVDQNGSLDLNGVNHPGNGGVRPVITIPKSILQ